MKKRRIYISGGVSGRQKSEYLPEFTAAAKQWENIGWKAVVPVSAFGWLQPVFERLPYHLQIFICLVLLSRCQRIYMLPNWSLSRGAKFERAFAEYMGIEINIDSETSEGFHSKTVEALSALGKAMSKI